MNCQVTDVQVTGISSGASALIGLTVTTIPDFGLNTGKTGSVNLNVSASETRVTKRAEDATLGGAQFVQWKIGDTEILGVAALQWTADRMVVGVETKEPLI